jgi:hypothetical protein
LLSRAAAAVVKILVEPDELDLVPTNPDPEPKPTPGQDIETGACLATRTVWRCARINTWVEKWAILVHPARKPNSTNGS